MILNTNPKSPIYLSTKKAAEALGVAEVTLRIWRQRGKGPTFVRLGRNVKYFKAEIIALIEARTAKA